MPAPRAVVCAALLTVVGLTVAGCGDDSPSGDTGRGVPASTAPATSTSTQQGEQMNIQITIDGQRLRATIFDSAAGRDLIAQLPLTIDMIDHGAVEKTGPLPSPLSRDG